MNGLILIDKSAGCTSHDVVNRWRRLANTKRVGHLGTLDPMATGLLALLTGPVTRLADYYSSAVKTYRASLLFGFTSDTYDAEGTVKETGCPAPELVAIEAALIRFRGALQQLPPTISAKKIGGVPAYKLARRNQPVELKECEIVISRLEMTNYADGKLDIEVECSAGTYIRSLAHDLGKVLGTGAILTALRRTRAGEFSVEDAWTLEQLETLAREGRLAEAVRPARELLPQLPTVYVDDATETAIRQGRQFRALPFNLPPDAPQVRAITREGGLIAIGKIVVPGLYQPVIVFPGHE